MIFTTLLYNAALLLSLGFLYSLIARHWYENKKSSQIYKGLLFGCFAIGVMANPMQFMPGVVFDTRSVVVSAVGLFGGLLPAGIAVVMAVAFRALEGGQGALTGMLVILVSALVGLLYRRWGQGVSQAMRATRLYLFGMAVHVAMLLCMFTLPLPTAWEVLRAITLPVLLIYPLVTMLLALLLAEGETNLRAVKSLEESENRFRTSFDHTSTGMVMTGVDGRLIRVNDQFCRMLDSDSRDLVGKSFTDITHPEDLAAGKEFVEKTLAGELQSAQFEKRYLRKDGTAVWTKVSASLVRDAHGHPLNFITTVQDISKSRRTEQALRDSEAKLSEAQKIVKLGWWSFDLKTEQVTWSDEIRAIYEVDDQEITRERSFEFVHPDDREYMDNLRAKIIADGSAEFEHRIVLDGGRVKWLWGKARVEYGQDGTTERIGGVAQDITKRMQAEDELRQSDANFKYLFDNMLNGFAYCQMLFENGQPRDFIYLMTNDAFEKLTELKDVVGKKASEAIPGIRQADPELFEIYGRVALTGRPEQFETYVQALDMWFSVSVYSPRREYFVAVFDVITERKNTEIALRESQERFRRALDDMPDVLVIYDPDLTIRYINAATLRLTDRPACHFIGKRDDEIWPPEVYQTFMPALRDAVETLETRSVETEVTLQDGKPLYLHITCVPLTDEKGRLREVLGITHNLTEQRRAELDKANLEGQLRQAQKMEAIGTLAGGIAHDFNNILSVIMGYAELASDEIPAASKVRGPLAQILTATNRAQNLVKQILTFSRKGGVETKPVDLNHHVTVVVELIKQTIPKMVQIELLLGQDLKNISADPNHIEQILMNLATNAADAMPDGGRLVIETENVFLDAEYGRKHLGCKPGHYVRLQVSDTGHGMTKEVMGQMFDPFFTTKEIGKGTGLGLATIYGIVKTLGGVINCYSEPGEGTIFKIYLPALEDVDVAEAAIRPESGELPGGSENILLVDDEKPLLELGRLMLIRMGYGVLMTGSGEEALEAYKQNPGGIDLVIMDISMPGMGGNKCIRELLKLDPEAKVLVASGYSRNGQLKDTLAAGAAGYIAKPFRKFELLQTVRKALDA